MSIIQKGFTGVAAALVALTLFAGSAGAQVVDFNDPAFARTVGPTSIPIGHMEFCQRNPDECGPSTLPASVVQLTPYRWEQLVAINNRVNAEIVPVTDADLYNVAELWTYPDGYGDCEDIALAKRRELIRSGWDPSTLLIAVVRQQNGDGHAVLMARTDRGDLILDNLESSIRIWSETPYQLVKRQSQAHAGEWVLIDDGRPVVTVASTK